MHVILFVISPTPQSHKHAITYHTITQAQHPTTCIYYRVYFTLHLPLPALLVFLLPIPPWFYCSSWSMSTTLLLPLKIGMSIADLLPLSPLYLYLVQQRQKAHALQKIKDTLDSRGTFMLFPFLLHPFPSSPIPLLLSFPLLPPSLTLISHHTKVKRSCHTKDQRHTYGIG